MLEAVPGYTGMAASSALSLYRGWATIVASGLRYLANVTEKEWQHSFFSRRYLIKTDFVRIRSVTPLAAGESFTLIYNVTDWYCKNEGTWGSGPNPSAYKTYYNCWTAGIWGIPGLG
jgi:hypothetical protein